MIKLTTYVNAAHTFPKGLSIDHNYSLRLGIVSSLLASLLSSVHSLLCAQIDSRFNSQRNVLNEPVASTLRCLPSPLWEPSEEEESAMADEMVDDREQQGPVLEGHLKEMKSTQRDSTCGVESLPRQHRLFEWITVIKQFPEKRHEGHGRG